ncbi:MAG: hypothetical protein ACI837_002667 [Crocinitomicaceae bacterium]|jgi:hypothetical protein
MWKLTSLLFIVISFGSFGQFNWTWTELSTMPFRTANNAVCEASVGGQDYVYSFGGIDTTKLYSGIHLRSFKYDVLADSWSEIAPLPDTLGKIASGASYVKDKIYILGGYHVFSGGSETSSDRVHVYNPTTDTYEADGAAIPVPIDDHVQCVYKDSLIFVITGWSNIGNVANVQVYNPTLDQWQVGTSTPNNTFFKTFGASGYIIGDSVYYHGGASGGTFGARKYMRKGYINPTDPTDITWTQMANAPGDEGYRSACSGAGTTVFWVGGSSLSYNFNGLAYAGGVGVEPSARILHFSTHNYQYADETAQPHGVMDLRGIAKLPNNRWIICGGMDSSQLVSNRTFLLENPLVSHSEVDENDDYQIFSNVNSIEIRTPSIHAGFLHDMSGRKLAEWEENDAFVINRDSYPTGIYLFVHHGKTIRIRI